MGHSFKKSLFNNDDSAFQTPFLRTDVLSSQYRLNTAFIERVNLTVRHGCSALARRTWATSQQAPQLLAHVQWWRASLCWLLVASDGPNWPVRTPHAVSCSLPIPQRKSTISSMPLLLFTTGEWTLCRGFSPSSRG